MASYPLLPGRGQIPDDKIRAAISQSGAEAVLITRILRVEREVNVTPATPPMMYGRGFYGWYGSAWSTLPPTVDTYNVLTIETTLWNPRTEKPLWTGTTQGTEVTDVNKATQDRESLRNEGQAYANQVVPAAQGNAARWDVARN